jgi:hypothetical protein
MKSQRFILVVLFPALLLAPSALAWDNTGHQVVAGIAWDNMKQPARQKAIALLNGAPGNACLKDLFPNDNRPLDVREREFFIRAATWPDLIRDGACRNLSHPDWHFADHFWKGFSGGTGNDAPKDAGIMTPSPNAVERLTVFRHVVPCDNQPCSSNAERAEDLAWILHLTGDVHQPLHNAARVTTASRNGDRGGNAFLLDSDRTPLHTYWDHIIDNSIAIQPNERGNHEMAYIDRVIRIIENDYPSASMADSLKPDNFAAWSDEGLKTAEAIAYPASLKPTSNDHPTPGEGYRKKVFAFADEAIALAGYRLADLLNRTLAP